MDELRKELAELKKDMDEFEKKLEQAWSEGNDIKIKEYRKKLETVSSLVFKLKDNK